MDSDCWTTVTFKGVTRVYGRGDATCSAGKCTGCTGPDNCIRDTQCPNSYRDFYAGAQHTLVARNMHAMQAYIDAQSDPDTRPLVIPVTAPPPNCNECGAYAIGHGLISCMQDNDLQYFRNSRKHELMEFPFSVDAFGYTYGLDLATSHTDHVHFALPLSDAIGAVAADVTWSMNACAVKTAGEKGTDGNPLWYTWSTQKYCKDNTGAWPASAVKCATSATCSNSQTCQPRVCGCVCTHNQECVNFYGADYSCKDGSNGSCEGGEACTCKKTTGNNDACALYGSYTCDTATNRCLDGGSADVCTGTGDECHAEL